MSSPCRWPTAIGVVLLLSLDTGWSQTRTAPRLDFLNDRLPIADSDLFDESSYIESGVGLSFGVDKRLTYLAGEYQEAARQFEQGVSMFKYKAEIWVYLARAYFYMKAPDRARLALERAQVLMPDLTDRLWQPLVESLLAEIRKRANNQQIQVYFYSPGQEDFLSLFRLYLFLEDYNSATGVLKSAAGRDGKLREQATTVSGESRQMRLTEADKWWALSQQLRVELSALGIEVPRDSLAAWGGWTEEAAFSPEGSDPTGSSTGSQAGSGRSSQVRDLEGSWRSWSKPPASVVTTDLKVLQLKIDYYGAEAEDFRTLFEAYLQGDDSHRASEVTVSLGREIDRLVILTSVAPDVQEEVRIQERVDLFEALKKELESLLPQTVKAVP